MFGQRTAERVTDGRSIDAGGYRPLVEGGEKRLGVLCSSAKACSAVRHEANLRLRSGWLLSRRTRRWRGDLVGSVGDA
jgi:hypothetical protein